MAFYKELTGVALEAYKEAVRTLRERAKRELGVGDDGIVVRPLRPDDLGLTGKWEFTINASGWNEVIDTTIEDNRFVCILGVFNAEDVGNCEQVKITREGSDARYWDVSPVRNFQDKIGYVDDPVTIDQNKSIKVSIYADPASTPATLTKFGFVGVVVERRGLLINP